MTNETASLAAKVNPHLNASFAEALNCKDWKVRPAPLPYEINWKNLENSIQKKKVLTVLTLVVEIIVLTSVLSITAGLAVVEVARDLYLTGMFLYPFILILFSFVFLVSLVLTHFSSFVLLCRYLLSFGRSHIYGEHCRCCGSHSPRSCRID